MLTLCPRCAAPLDPDGRCPACAGDGPDSIDAALEELGRQIRAVEASHAALRETLRGAAPAGPESAGAAADRSAGTGTSQAPNGVQEATAADEASELPADGQQAAWRPKRARVAIAVAALAFVMVALVAFALRVRNDTGPAVDALSSDRTTIAPGGSARLCVRASNAASVEVLPLGGRLPSPAGGCVTVQPPITTSFLAVATADDGRQARRELTVSVIAPPVRVRIDRLSATPRRVPLGGTTHICYAVSGADVLRMSPSLGTLTRLHACRNVTLRTPGRHTYRLAAVGAGGRTALAQVSIDVRPRPHRVVAHDNGHRARAAIYQFDATPQQIARGQLVSLCAGIAPDAHGYLSGVGILPPGITRCYRMRPRATTAYALDVRSGPSRARKTVAVVVHR